MAKYNGFFKDFEEISFIIKVFICKRTLLEHEEVIEKSWNKRFYNNSLEFHKDFSDIPQHEYLRIEANFRFFSNFWKGQAVILKYNEEILWLDHHEWQGFLLKFIVF